MQPVDNLEVRRKKRMKTFYLTDAGKVRSHNEDSVTILKMMPANIYLSLLMGWAAIVLVK